MSVLPEDEKSSETKTEQGEEKKTEGETEGKKENERIPGTNRFLAGMIAGILAAFACFFLFFFGPRLAGNLADTGNPGAKILTKRSTRTKLSEAEQIIEDSYLYEVDADTLEDFLFLGVAAGLEDPYAAYYTKEELSSTMDSVRGEYYGIGAVIGMDPDTGICFVSSVYEDSPAGEAGLREEDQLLAVNGESVEGLTVTELVELIREQETFTMTVYRPEAEKEFELSITCAEVIPKVVNEEMLEGDIGYLQLTEFTESALEQFQEAVADLNGQGMRALILDVRGNPGGLLSSVCDILDEILPGGLMVYTEDKNGRREDYEASEERSVTCPVAVLVNGESASGAEILAGAIQDYGIGPVIGTQTYGKGVVQKTYSLSDGSALKLTVSTYYTPNGQEIDGNGITPDLVVEESDADGEDAALACACTELGG